MGIGRRQFLRIFGATLAAAANPAAAVTMLDNFYVNRRLGIGFRKPSTWTFSDVKQMEAIVDDQIFDVDDPDLLKEIKESAGSPLLTLSKDKISPESRRFTPGMHVYVDYLENEKDAKTRPIFPFYLSHFDIRLLRDTLKDYETTTEPVLKWISECPAIEYESVFTFEHANIRPTLVRLRSMLIYQGKAFYTLRMFDSPQLGGDRVFNFAPLVESIRVV